ncbi:NAD(P)-dependent dehydrogenase (short-subunit alcohol dehydrogenase family) [Bradyrhizobium sp. AZCC 1719]
MNQEPGVALLVGVGDAIGAAVARRFAAANYKVCITALPWSGLQQHPAS